MISHSLCIQSLLLFCITVMQITTSVNFEFAENETDLISLQTIKSNIVHDPQGVLNSWNDSHHFCDWQGITCGFRHRRVTVLSLNTRGLTGSLSPYIGNLSFLRKIDLSNNNFQGEIPPQVGRLLRLEDLQLYNNSFGGEIPGNLSHCSKLKFLFLGRNNLIGRIPREFVSLYNLKQIVLYSNNLIGGIPPFLGNLTSLESIRLSKNSLDGNIPYSLGQLKKLTALILGNNNLSGTIPPTIYNLSLLVNFSLSVNQFHGSLPPNIGLALPHLKIFQLTSNFFGGSIPVSLSNASELEIIDVNDNDFSGKLSIDFGGMEHLYFLSLSLNNLGSGEGDEIRFINSLVNCSNLMVFGIASNQFRGALPHSIANLSTKFKILAVDDNQLYGALPSRIGNLVNLQILSMSYNKFKGKIPKELGKLQNLHYIDISYNKLSSEIPSSLGNLSMLDILILNNNKLSGVIPSSLGHLKQLTNLDLSQNVLNWTTPKELFETSPLISVNLSRNQLVGSIPPNIGNLQSLSIFDVSYNCLSGKIPSELSLCSSLEYLYMDNNFFHGSIPSTFSSLRGIRSIDLSLNNLSGEIPKFLETLALEKLNLSFNNLKGEVPRKGIFANASAISVAGNSNQLCGGIVELDLPKCASNEPKEKKISRPSKFLVSTVSALLGLVMVYFFIFCWVRKRSGKHPSKFEPMLIKELLNVSYEKIHNATGGFSSTNLIGVGTFGFVYKGILEPDGATIAVKVLNLQSQEASKSFMAECRALRNIRHRNLVKVITSCSSINFQGNDFKAIIYKYMPNGSLEKWLHPMPEVLLGIENLNLLQRISIAIDVATAIDYLHHQCQEPIIHCDLKPSNVLLDNDMTAHVGDFGLARFLHEVSNPNQSSFLGVRGTIGYAAPEYGLGSKVSTNGDVYSYGILLLEMITRKRPTDLMFEGGLNLHNFARMALPNQVMSIVDPILLIDDENHILTETRSTSKVKCLISIVSIGVACSMESPEDRMNITDVVHKLQLARNILCRPRTILNRQEGLRN